MGLRQQYKAEQQREHEVTLPSGLVLRLRRPDMSTIVFKYDLTNDNITAWQKLKALGVEDKEAATAARKAALLDAQNLVFAVLEESCVTPRFVRTEAEAEADASGDTLCVDDLSGDDVMQIRIAINDLLGLSREEGQAVSPFPESGGAGDAGAQVPYATEQAAAGLEIVGA